MQTAQSPAELIKKARKIRGLTQIEFGEEIDRPQSLVSKYERGEADPPSHVIIHCMTILGNQEAAEASAKDIADLVQRRLSAPEFAHFRSALMTLLETVAIEDHRNRPGV